jgi:ribosomal protein S18 acetylase RimI-like enzyme
MEENRMEQDPYIGQVIVQVIRAIEENLMEAWLSLEVHPAVEIYAGDDLTQFVSGIPYPLCNGVFHARLDPERIDDAVENALGLFRERGLPGLWWVGPSSEPSNLETVLERHGLVRTGESVGMAMDLGPMPSPPALPEGFEIRRVGGEDLLRRWIHIFSTVFSLPPEAAGFFFECYRDIGSDPSSPLLHFAALHGGKPAGTASLMLGAGAAGLYNVAVPPEYRNRGLGTALTLCALEEAKNLGYGLGVLHAVEGKDSLYRRLGFQEYCRFVSYLWQ